MMDRICFFMVLWVPTLLVPVLFSLFSIAVFVLKFKKVINYSDFWFEWSLAI